MQQYRDIKARHPQSILFFRMGDFYEMFEDDAKLAARELGLTLTSRNNGGAAEVPLAGVPVKAATEYLRRLVAKGHRVAICEQIEDPKLAKGVVRRAVVETVTPGSVLSEDWLVRNRNNYLAAVDPRGADAGIATLDITTGELILEVVPRAEVDLALARYEAREVVLPAETAVAAPVPTTTMREAWEFDPELAREDLMRIYGVASLDGLGIAEDDRPAIGAAGALLRYARELKPGGLPHLAHPRLVRRGDVLPLDEMTRRNLELVEPLRAGAEGATLLDVVDRTLTPMGGRLLRRWLLRRYLRHRETRQNQDRNPDFASGKLAQTSLHRAIRALADQAHLMGSHKHISPNGPGVTTFLNPSLTVPPGLLSPGTQERISPFSPPKPGFASVVVWITGLAETTPGAAGAAAAC
jgi:DNA mismatch repair protein MutS